MKKSANENSRKTSEIGLQGKSLSKLYIFFLSLLVLIFNALVANLIVQKLGTYTYFLRTKFSLYIHRVFIIHTTSLKHFKLTIHCGFSKLNYNV